MPSPMHYLYGLYNKSHRSSHRYSFNSCGNSVPSQSRIASAPHSPIISSVSCNHIKVCRYCHTSFFCLPFLYPPHLNLLVFLLIFDTYRILCLRTKCNPVSYTFLHHFCTIIHLTEFLTCASLLIKQTDIRGELWIEFFIIKSQKMNGARPYWTFFGRKDFPDTSSLL